MSRVLDRSGLGLGVDYVRMVYGWDLYDLEPRTLDRERILELHVIAFLGSSNGGKIKTHTPASILRESSS